MANLEREIIIGLKIKKYSYFYIWLSLCFLFCLNFQVSRCEESETGRHVAISSVNSSTDAFLGDSDSDNQKPTTRTSTSTSSHLKIFNVSNFTFLVSNETLDKIRPILTRQAASENKNNHSNLNGTNQRLTRPFMATAFAQFIDYLVHKPMLFSNYNVPQASQMGHSEQEEFRPPTRFCQCGITPVKMGSSKMVDGSTARMREFPWRVFLESGFGWEKVLCGGTLISNQWILTSASCISKRAHFVMIYLGAYDTSLAGEAKSFITVASHWIIHPNYDEAKHDFDIALIKLTSPLESRESFHPICLPWNSKYRDYSDTIVTASGWGAVREGDEPSFILRKIKLPLMPTHECMYAMTRANRSAASITMNMMCTYRKDSKLCRGDFGGSLDYLDPTTKATYAVGIPLDLGYNCNTSDEQYPQIATKIVNFLDWIYISTKKADFCVL